ncbi:Methyl-accepting chemotaxis protein McpC [compost metagenome]
MDANPLFEEQIQSVKETSKIFVSVQQKMEGFVDHLSMVTNSIDELNQSQSVMSEAMTNVSAVAEESSATSEEVASLSNEQENIGNHLVELSKKLENVSLGLKDTLSKFTV